MSFVLMHRCEMCTLKGFPAFIICQSSIGASVVVVAVGEAESMTIDGVLQVGINLAENACMHCHNEEEGRTRTLCEVG